MSDILSPVTADRATCGTAEAGELLGVSQDTVARLFDAGELDGYRTSATLGHRRIYLDSVEAYRARQRGEDSSHGAPPAEIA